MCFYIYYIESIYVVTNIYINIFFLNLSYLPLTIHWSLERSSFPDVLVGVFGGFASVFQIYAAWNAVA